MQYGDDEWVQRWNAGRLVAGVDEVLRSWSRDPGRAAGRLDSLLRAAGPRVVMLLEGIYRGRHRSVAPMLSADVGALTADFGPHAAAVAALLTLDRSGYLRETGVRWLADRDEQFALPFLLLRLNDPVDPVRRGAASAVLQRLSVGHADLLVRLLPLIEGLGARQRAGPAVRTIRELLLSDDPARRTALWAGARGDDPAVRACCLRLLAVVGRPGSEACRRQMRDL